MAARRRPAELVCPTLKIVDTGLAIRGYDTKGNLVCRLVLNANGVDVYRAKGKQPIRGFGWEELVQLAESTRS